MHLMYKALIERSKAVTIQYLRRTNGDKRIKIIIYHCFMILLRNYSLVRHLLIVCIIKQSFIQALLLTSVFYKGLSFMVLGHNPTRGSTFALAAGGSRGRCKSPCKPPFGYFSDPMFSNSLSMYNSVVHLF